MTLLEVWEPENITRGKVRGVGRVRQSFIVLVCEILMGKLALVSKCVIMKKFDTMLTSVWSDCLVEMVDLSKHRLWYFLVTLFLSSFVFCLA